MRLKRRSFLVAGLAICLLKNKAMAVKCFSNREELFDKKWEGKVNCSPLYSQQIDRFNPVAHFKKIKSLGAFGPCMIGIDLGPYAHTIDYPNLNLLKDLVLENWDGPLTISWHCINPFTYSSERREFGSSIQRGASKDLSGIDEFSDIYTAGSRANSVFNEQFNYVFNGFIKPVSESGRTILLRPFHECNGGWFWWSAYKKSNGEKIFVHPFDYALLYRYFHGLVVNSGSSDIVWLFNYSDNVSDGFYSVRDYFFGVSDIVDIVTFDLYSNTILERSIEFAASLGKPIALAEFGPSLQNGEWDSLDIVAPLKSYAKKLLWINFWQDVGFRKLALSSQKNYSKFLRTNSMRVCAP